MVYHDETSAELWHWFVLAASTLASGSMAGLLSRRWSGSCSWCSPLHWAPTVTWTPATSAWLPTARYAATPRLFNARLHAQLIYNRHLFSCNKLRRARATLPMSGTCSNLLPACGLMDVAVSEAHLLLFALKFCQLRRLQAARSATFYISRAGRSMFSM